MRIIFDTNFLIYTIKYKIDFISELNRICEFDYEICLLDRSVDELKKLKIPEAKITIALLDRFKIVDTKDSKFNEVDDILVDLASSETIIATQDLNLKKRIRVKTKKIITIKQKKYYIFE